MTPITQIIVTHHAHTRYRQHCGRTNVACSEIMDLVRQAKVVTRKCTDWYAPLVRAKVQPGASFFYHEDTNLVIVGEHTDAGLLRVVTLYPLVSALGFKLQARTMRSLVRRNRREVARADADAHRRASG